MTASRAGTRQQLPEGFAAQLRALLDVDNALLNTLLAASRDKGWSTPSLAVALDRNPPAVSKRIERARAQHGNHPLQIAAAAATAGYTIPEAPKTHAMIDGKQLDAEKIAALREMQLIASRVNGAMPVAHPARRVSEQYSAELDRLVSKEGYTPYYLSKILGISHRAVTSRLERHHFRDPCPSVDGTPSGIYFNRKIGDVGQGAPRLSAEQRAELRTLWQAYSDGKRGSRTRLAGKLTGYLEHGFTLANLSQTMSTRDARVRYGALQDVLGLPVAGAA
jgi:hypothetical protein